MPNQRLDAIRTRMYVFTSGVVQLGEPERGDDSA
jgi:hypothetical protein